MFDLLINAARLAVSKDVRDGTNALIDALTRSPEWRKEICTIDARISPDERERSNLLSELTAKKLESMEYRGESIRSFLTVFGELSANAFEHGIRNAKDRVARIVLEISPTYVSCSVHNPRGSPADLAKWIQAGAAHLRETRKLGRGRGLLLACREADTIEQFGDDAVKAAVFRDFVDIATQAVDGVPVVVAKSGHSNPSFGRRVVEYIERIDFSSVVLCLDAREFYRFMDIEYDELMKDYCPDLSKSYKAILTLVDRHKTAGDKDVRLVVTNEHVRDLLPDDVVYATIRSAIDDLRAVSKSTWKSDATGSKDAAANALKAFFKP